MGTKTLMEEEEEEEEKVEVVVVVVVVVTLVVARLHACMAYMHGPQLASERGDRWSLDGSTDHKLVRTERERELQEKE